MPIAGYAPATTKHEPAISAVELDVLRRMMRPVMERAMQERRGTALHL